MAEPALTIISLCLLTSMPSFMDCMTVMGISSGNTSVMMLMLSVLALLVGAAASRILRRAIMYWGRLGSMAWYNISDGVCSTSTSGRDRGLEAISSSRLI